MSNWLRETIPANLFIAKMIDGTNARKIFRAKPGIMAVTIALRMAMSWKALCVKSMGRLVGRAMQASTQHAPIHTLLCGGATALFPSRSMLPYTNKFQVPSFEVYLTRLFVERMA